MRNDARQERTVTTATVSPYHHGDYEKYNVFLSDRPKEATDKTYRTFTDGSPIEKAMYGIEWETQAWGITSERIYANILRDVVFAPFHDTMWKIERDVSLQANADISAECITQPMTKAYIRNHYRDFKYMWEKAETFGIDCVRTGDCGMHVHISNTTFGRSKKTQDEAIRKFVYIINKHYKLMVYALNRNPNRTGYAPIMQRFTKKETCQTFDLNAQYNDHHVCINMGHYAEGNIELRLVGGQINFPCFRNSLETVFHLTEKVKTISWKDCDDVTKIFSGCNQYVFNRLNTFVRQNNQISEAQLETIRTNVIRENLL